MKNLKDMTYEEFEKAVKDAFDVGSKPQSDVNAFFGEAKTVKYLKEAYEYRNDKMLGISINSVADCLDMMY